MQVVDLPFFVVLSFLAPVVLVVTADATAQIVNGIESNADRNGMTVVLNEQGPIQKKN